MKKIYLDESGNTGSISINKVGNINIGSQNYFVYGGVIVDESEEGDLTQKYLSFKDKNQMLQDDKGEIKGNDLFIREHNEVLEDFIFNYLDDKNFYVNVYDKHFYIATQLTLSLVGFEYRDNNLAVFYENVNSLLKISDFSKVENRFLKATNLSDDKQREKLLVATFRCLRRITRGNAEFKYLDSKLKKAIKDKEVVSEISKSILAKGAYKLDNSITNLINLTAIGELLVELLRQKRIGESVDIKLDPICRIDEVIVDELKRSIFKHQISISQGSYVDILIQYADNIVSVIYKSFKDIITDFKNRGRGWEIDKGNLWSLLVFSLILNKIKSKNIKFTLSIDDWAFCLTVERLRLGVEAISHNPNISNLVTLLNQLDDFSSINDEFWTTFEESRSNIIKNYQNKEYNILSDLSSLMIGRS
ncbi:TPA: hypothetical protein ACGO6G_000715 [Streptococcus suis]